MRAVSERAEERDDGRESERSDERLNGRPFRCGGVYVNLTNGFKGEDELVDNYDKWLYLLKNMSQPQSRPKVFGETGFGRLFEMSELCNFTAGQ